MRILFTGASSFTGCWFVRGLVAAGHQVVAIARRHRADYTGVRSTRIESLYEAGVEVVEDCSFGDGTFRDLVERGGWDVLCHHAAETSGYRDPRFDALAALAGNARNLPEIADALAAGACRRIVLTGSVFEADEGNGDDPGAFSPYGLSKTLTCEAFRFYAGAAGLHLGKFVIPNPFGPLEEPRFTSYLLHAWLSGEVPVVRTPEYVRDNIHVSLLALAYGAFVQDLPDDTGTSVLRPSGYRGRQADFALRVASEMEPRLGRRCPLELARQTDSSEPRVRVNTDEPDVRALEWDESAAWDELAEFYLRARSEPAPV